MDVLSSSGKVSESTSEPIITNQFCDTETAACKQNDIKRCKQDKELLKYKLYRYRIPGDGNCLFRAVAFLLKLNQDQSHSCLREAVVCWMKVHVQELINKHLIESEDEIESISKIGSWPGVACVASLANMLGVNINVYFGGDEGPVDIQCFQPEKENASETLKLVYMYDGHYDALVDEPNLPNPEYEEWMKAVEQDLDRNVALAKCLEAESLNKDLNHRENQTTDPTEHHEKNLPVFRSECSIPISVIKEETSKRNQTRRVIYLKPSFNDCMAPCCNGPIFPVQMFPSTYF